MAAAKLVVGAKLVAGKVNPHLVEFLDFAGHRLKGIALCAQAHGVVGGNALRGGAAALSPREIDLVV